MPLFDLTPGLEPLAAKLTECEAVAQQLVGKKRVRVGGPDEWPRFRLAVGVDTLLHVCLRRLLEILDSLVRDVNGRAFAPVWVGMRALVEVSALMFDLAGRCKDCVDGPTPEKFRSLDEHLYQLSLGIKSPTWS